MNIDNFNGLNIKLEYEDIIKNYCDELSLSIYTKSRLMFKGSGNYAKGWTYKVKKVKDDYEGVVYNETEYRLTHLLEKGHLIKNKYGSYGYTAPRSHIKPAFDDIKDKFINDMSKCSYEMTNK